MDNFPHSKLAYLGVILLGLSLVFMDTFFFSFIRVGEVSLLSSLAILVAFTLIGGLAQIGVLVLSITFFLAAFSSLPLWLSFIVFVGLPGLLTYFRLRYLSDPFLWLVAWVIVVVNFIGGAILFFYSHGLSFQVFGQVCFFSLANSMLGIVFFLVARSVSLRAGKQGRIRV